MKILLRMSLLLCLGVLTSVLVNLAVVRATDETKEFFNSSMTGIKIQVNANASIEPNQNLTVIMTLETKAEVHIDRVDLEVFGFVNGTDQILIGDFSDSNFDMNNTSREYVEVVAVPDFVWGVTFGEISLAYVVNMSEIALRFPNVVTGFPLTTVKNVLMENLQDQVRNLNESFNQLSQKYADLNRSFADLNATYWSLDQNYTSAQNSLGELDNTRRLSIILAITTVCFLATTIYIILRRPRDYW